MLVWMLGLIVILTAGIHNWSWLWLSEKWMIKNRWYRPDVFFVVQTIIGVAIAFYGIFAMQ